MSLERGRGPGKIAAAAGVGVVVVAIENRAIGTSLIATLSPADALELAAELTEAAGEAAAWSPASG